MRTHNILAAAMISLLLFSSCRILSRTQRKIAVSYIAGHPDTAATWCARDFPCIPEKLIHGIPVHTRDTTYLPGDSIPCPAGAPSVKCPPGLVIHDSTTIHDTIPIRDSAQLRILTGKLDSTRAALTQVSTDRDRLKSGRNTWRDIAIPCGLVILVAVGTWAVIKFKLV